MSAAMRQQQEENAPTEKDSLVGRAVVMQPIDSTRSFGTLSVWSNWSESWNSWRPRSWRPLVTSRHTVGLVITVLVLLGIATTISWFSRGGGGASENVWLDDENHKHGAASSSTNAAFVQAMQIIEQRIQGHLVWPTSDAFVNASHVWNQCYREQPPAVVVQVANEHDVQVVVPFLAEIQHNFSIPFRIRSGGHSYAGWSTVPHGIILSLDNLRQLSFRQDDDSNDDTAIVTAGPAVRDSDILQHILLERGYASVIGICPDVALGGYTLGGGQGALTRLYGLAIDTLRSVRIVLATGQVVTASPTDHAVLFWALRGAGQQNFGVVTQLEYTYYPIQDDAIMFATGEIPVHLVPYFLTALGRDEPPRQASASFKILGRSAMERNDAPLTAAVWWIGDVEQGRLYWKETLHRFLPSDVVNGFGFQKASLYNESYAVDPHNNMRVRVYNGLLYPQENTPEVWRFINDHLWNVCQQTPYAGAYIELWGGNSAFNAVASNETAFYWREAVYLVRLEIFMPADLGPDEFISLQALFDSQWVFIEPYLKGSYTNYAQASLEHPAQRTFGKNLPRLQLVKEKYDPDNVFHHPHSIPIPTHKRT